MAIAIPPTAWNWPRILPRPLYWSLHGYDWAPIIGRPGRTFNLHLRVFGAGFDLMLDEGFRRWSFSIGARWLVNLALGHFAETPPEFQDPSGLGPKLYPEKRYVEITVLLLALSLGKEAAQRWRARLFFNGRRLFRKVR